MYENSYAKSVKMWLTICQRKTKLKKLAVNEMQALLCLTIYFRLRIKFGHHPYLREDR